MNYLFILEGDNTEPGILEKILPKYGFKVTKKNKVTRYKDIDFTSVILENDINNAIIMTAPCSKLEYALGAYKRDNPDFSFIFGNREIFSGIYLVYDVDHTPREDLIEIFNYHNDETDRGLLLLSCPCIEILTNCNRIRKIKIFKHIDEYKKRRNIHIDKKYHISCKDYIVNNFDKICLHYLKKNRREFKETNIMEHPKLIINKINSTSERSSTYCEFRYFTTVLYVAIANMLGITKKIDHYDDVARLFGNKTLMERAKGLLNSTRK